VVSEHPYQTRLIELIRARPRPSPTTQDRQTPELSREPQPERDALATEQQSPDEDRDQALGVEIG
jgi:hypothetical protein